MRCKGGCRWEKNNSSTREVRQAASVRKRELNSPYTGDFTTYAYLVGGWCFFFALPLWNRSSSIGMIKFPIYGKIKVMFQSPPNSICPILTPYLWTSANLHTPKQSDWAWRLLSLQCGEKLENVTGRPTEKLLRNRTHEVAFRKPMFHVQLCLREPNIMILCPACNCLWSCGSILQQLFI